MANVLVIEDEQNVAKLIERCLQKSDGHRSYLASTGKSGLELFRQVSPDAVILDLMLPDINGLEVCERIREMSFRGGKLPPIIVMLSAKAEPADRATSYNTGANVYLCKPFEPEELTACLRAQLRQQRLQIEAAQSKVIATNHLQIDPEQQIARIRYSGTQGWQSLFLTALELKLLATLAGRRHRVWSRDELIEQVWDLGSDVSERAVDSLVKRLRAKLSDVSNACIKTVPGLGYRFEDSPEDD